MYGTLEKENRTLYQILQPYVWTMLDNTGSFANYAGKGIYEALKNGASWIYSKLTNDVIPYAA